MKYKIGDMVMVKTDLKVGTFYGYCFCKLMEKFLGKKVTINHVSGEYNRYQISEDPWGHYWTDEMFEDFRYNYKKGTKLRRINRNFEQREIFVGDIITIEEDIQTNYEGYEIYIYGNYFGDIKNYEEVKEYEIRGREIVNRLIDSLYDKEICMKGGNQMTDIETLKSFNPKNLSEGKRQAEEEKANYEASEAKKSYTALINKKEELERIIKTTNEELKKIKESLILFK